MRRAVQRESMVEVKGSNKRSLGRWLFMVIVQEVED
jgi:hypothetical protein